MTTPNPAAVAVLLAADLTDPHHPTIDGQPLTEEQQHAYDNATIVDLEAAHHLRTTEIIAEQEALTAANDLLDLLAPYLENAPADVTMGDVIPHLPDEIRAKVEQLTEIAFPTGYVTVNRGAA